MLSLKIETRPNRSTSSESERYESQREREVIELLPIRSFLVTGGMGHNQIAVVFFLLFIHVSVSVSSPESILQLLPSDASSLPSYNNIGHRKFISDDFLFCEGWRFTIETNDAGPWNRIPSRCLSFVQDYMTGDRYLSDSEAVADSALAFAKKIEVSDDGKDAWVFDIDETLLSNVPFYQLHGFGLVQKIFLHNFYLWNFCAHFGFTALITTTMIEDMPI